MNIYVLTAIIIINHIYFIFLGKFQFKFIILVIMLQNINQIIKTNIYNKIQII